MEACRKEEIRIEGGDRFAGRYHTRCDIGPTSKRKRSGVAAIR